MWRIRFDIFNPSELLQSIMAWASIHSRGRRHCLESLVLAHSNQCLMIRLASSIAGKLRQFPRLMLVLNEPFERPCDFPFLIALSTGRQSASFMDKLVPSLGQLGEFNKVG